MDRCEQVMNEQSFDSARGGLEQSHVQQKQTIITLTIQQITMARCISFRQSGRTPTLWLLRWPVRDDLSFLACDHFGACLRHGKLCKSGASSPARAMWQESQDSQVLIFASLRHLDGFR
jgi:hypothetical protein